MRCVGMSRFAIGSSVLRFGYKLFSRACLCVQKLYIYTYTRVCVFSREIGISSRPGSFLIAMAVVSLVKGVISLVPEEV